MAPLLKIANSKSFFFKVINRLTTEFAHLDDKKFGGETGIEIRTKIGEALVRITRLLGEMTVSHKNKLLNPFLAQLGHPGKEPFK